MLVRMLIGPHTGDVVDVTPAIARGLLADGRAVPVEGQHYPAAVLPSVRRPDAGPVPVTQTPPVTRRGKGKR